MKFTNLLSILTALAIANSAASVYTCTVEPLGDSSLDDAPNIIAAFKECDKYNGKVVFLNETYHINTVMNTTGLSNVQVDLQGTLLVGHLLLMQIIGC
jgi:galacturan 1,4-alpha-galacturonidase